MISVSIDYKSLMLEEKNNQEHQYRIENLSSGMDLTEFFNNSNLNISKFLKTGSGTISPNTANLSFLISKNITEDVLVRDFSYKYRDSLFKNKRWKDILAIEFIDEYLVKNNNIIRITDIFNGEEIVVFKGIVREVKRRDTELFREISITLDDNTIIGYENVFSKEEVFKDCYFSNNSDKERSLFHILAKKMGFEYDEIDIKDIKINNEYLKIPIIYFEKGKKIIEKLAELVRSVYGNIYTKSNGNLTITSYLDKSYLKENNIVLTNDFKKYKGNNKYPFPILSFIEHREIQNKENKVEVKYKQLKEIENQTLFILNGNNATSNDSKIVLKRESDGVSGKAWKIELPNYIGKLRVYIKAYKLNLSYGLGTMSEREDFDVIDENEANKNPYYVDDLDNVIYLQEETLKKLYTLNLEEGSKKGTLIFNYPEGEHQSIYIQAFKIIGTLVEEYKDNSIIYYENKEEIENIKNVSYRYIVNKEQAKEVAKHTFYNECRDSVEYTLRTNNLPFLELEDIIELDYKKYKGKFKIISIIQNNLYTELNLKKYREYEGVPNNFLEEKSSLPEMNYLVTRLKEEEAKEKIFSGEYRYNENNQEIDYIRFPKGYNINNYNIVAYIKEIPLNVNGGIKVICDIFKSASENGFYIKVGILNNRNQIIKGGLATWIAIRKE